MSEHSTAKDLGLDLATDDGLYGWFLASLLFGRPVQESVAIQAWKVLNEDGFSSPESFVGASTSRIDTDLWNANYRHLVGVMTAELPRVMEDMITAYGSLRALVATAESRSQLETRLEGFKGVGPKTAEIFLREITDDMIGSSAA